MEAFIRELESKEILTKPQAELLGAVHSRRLIPVFFELRILLFLGAAFFVGGVGKTLAGYWEHLGHISILSVLSASVVSSFWYVLKKAPPYALEKVFAPNLGFDYVLLLSCLLLGTEISYIEKHFHLLGAYWDYYLLGSSALFIFLAYRFDNRLVLVSGLGTLATWYGLRLNLSLMDLPDHGIGYGALVLAMGLWLRRQQIKTHFTEVYANFAGHILFISLLAVDGQMKSESLFLVVGCRGKG